MAKNPITILAEGNKLLDELERKLMGVNSNLLEISKTARGANLKDYFNVKAPNEVNEKLKLQKTIIEQLNAEVRERDRLEKALSNQLAKNKLAESEINKELVKQRFETAERNKQIKASVILSSKLSTEYQKLVVKMNQAGRAKQNLVAKQAQGIKLSNLEQKELKQSSKDFLRYQKAVLKADASIGRFQRNVGNYGSALGKAGLALRGFAGAFGVLSAGTIALEIFNLTKEIDGLDKALLQVTETQEGFAQAQTFIKSLAEEAGVEINGLQKAYTKFFAAAKTTNLTLEETQNIFRQTAKAGAVLGLSTDDINGSMKALEQILSKGKVQAEEIRGQLGERLPGAFQILAKSMGLTTAQLSKQLELGNVLSEEVLPGFADQLAKTYGLDGVRRVETLTAAQNRLGNAWTEFVRTLDGSEGTLTKTFTFVIDGLADILKGLSVINTSLDEFNGKISSGVVQKQTERYKELGSEAAAYAEIEKNKSTLLLGNYKKEIEAQEKILEKYEDYTSLQKFVDAGHRRATKEIERLNKEVAIQEGILKAAKIQLGEITVKTEENTEANKENNDVINKGITALTSSMAFMRNEIKILEEKREKLATTSEEYANYTSEIESATGALHRLEDALKGVSKNGASELESQGTSLFSTSLDGIGNSGFDDIQNRIDANIIAEEKIREEAEKTAEVRKQLESDLTYALVDFTNTLFDAKVQKYDDEIQKNADHYTALLDNENLSEQQRSALEAERDRKKAVIEKKKRAELRKQAVFNKAVALGEIAINTAVAVSKVIGQAGLLGIPLSALVIALGAIQAATVIATPIPAYKDGKRQGEGKDGVALLNDGGKDELKISKDGSMERIVGRNVLGHVKKSDTIIPDADKYLSSMSDSELYNNLYKHTILASMQGQSDTINAYLISKSINNQTDRMIKAFSKNKPKVNVYNNIDTSVGEDIKFLMSLNNTL